MLTIIRSPDGYAIRLPTAPCVSETNAPEEIENVFCTLIQTPHFHAMKSDGGYCAIQHIQPCHSFYVWPSACEFVRALIK